MEKSKSKSKVSELSYDQALTELQKLVDGLMSEQVSIDSLYENVSRANELVKICQEKLRVIDVKLKEEIE